MSAAQHSTVRRMRARRGVALLLVLATLVLVVTASAALVASASTSQHARCMNDDDRLSAELLIAVHAPILNWLRSKSSRAALPPDAPLPQVLLLDEAWEIVPCEAAERAPIMVEVVVMGFDQCGMVPWRAARAGSPLRLALSEEVRTAVDRVPIGDEDILGLDVAVLAEVERVFPGRSPGQPESPVPFGGVIATHGSATPRVNVNTAPRGLLEHAFRMAGRGGAEAVLATRALGRPASLPPARARAAGARDVDQDSRRRTTLATRVDLVGSSDAWAFSIEIRVGGVHRIWWTVYTLDAGEWRCVQRLAVLD